MWCKIKLKVCLSDSRGASGLLVVNKSTTIAERALDRQSPSVTAARDLV